MSDLLVAREKMSMPVYKEFDGAVSSSNVSIINHRMNALSVHSEPCRIGPNRVPERAASSTGAGPSLVPERGRV